jgi:glutaminyl-peptide cyclotransferase
MIPAEGSFLAEGVDMPEMNPVSHGAAGWRRRLSLAAGLMVLGSVLMFSSSTSQGQAPDKVRPDGGFAADRGPAAAAPVAFDAKRAMGYLDAVCAIGPRMSGTEGMTKQQELIQKHFEGLGAKVAYQRFKAKQRSVREMTEMANMVISWNPDIKTRVILCCHYDTRPIADQEPNQRDWRDPRRPFISANDGGSGVALLMELGNHMKDLTTQVGVDFVFFDGEEYVFDRDDNYFFGSKQFALEARKLKDVKYKAAILLDMIGGKNPNFPIEINSWKYAEPLVREVWGIAAELKVTAFRNDAFSKFAVEDDHLPLNRAGIPAIDIIDFDYRHWHRLTDTPENCSGEALDQMARVLSVWLQRTR